VISRKHHCIYIHIPKTAGTSIETMLGYHGAVLKRGWQDHRRLRNIQQAIWPLSRGRFMPADFARFVAQRYKGGSRGFDFVSNSEFNSFFKFAIVRNPWDRVYSWYRNVIRDPFHQKELGFSPDRSFDDFVANQLDCWALMPQLDWLVNEDGRVELDYIGRFEALDDSLVDICRALGMRNEVLPHELHSGSSDYRSAYSKNSRAVVAERYAKEISLFGYEFG